MYPGHDCAVDGGGHWYYGCRRSTGTGFDDLLPHVSLCAMHAAEMLAELVTRGADAGELDPSQEVLLDLLYWDERLRSRNKSLDAERRAAWAEVRELREELRVTRKEAGIVKARLTRLLRRAGGQQTYAVAFGERYIKIGRSVDPSKRMATLRAGNFSHPTDLDPGHARLVKVWPEDRELELHRSLAAYRVKGEVFDYTAPEVRRAVA